MTLDILETPCLAPPVPLQTERTHTGSMRYEGFWASSIPLANIVEVDRIAANPINRVDPMGTDAVTDSYIRQFRGTLDDELKDWTAKGWTVAIKNLTHLLDNSGTDLNYDAADIAHIRALKAPVGGWGWFWSAGGNLGSGWSIDELVQDDIRTKAKASPSGALAIKGHLNPRFMSGELFYAFGGLTIDYDGKLSCSKPVGHGAPHTYSYDVKVKISDFYNFLDHAFVDQFASSFNAAVALQSMGLARAFWDYGEWDLKGTGAWR
jgi:hypothetical protein